MKVIRLLLLLTVIIFCSPSILHSQEDNSDAVYLKLSREYTLNPDGSMDFHYRKEMKLLSYRSFQSLYGETFIVYHPVFQSLKINEAYIIMADGKKVPSPANAFNEVLPGFCANAPAYNALREMVITHSGTERNATINLDYTLHSQKDFFPALMGNELMAEYEPVREQNMVVRIPSNMKLNYSFLNGDALPAITDDGSFRVYTWKMKDVPAISTEEFQKSGYELYPRLVFSTAAGRDQVYSSFMKQPAFAYDVNAEMKKAVEDIRHESGENIDVVLKLQDKVVNDFRLYPIPMRNVGFISRPATETWKSNGGTLIEKAVLLISLLKEAGIEAEPVFIIKNTMYDDKIGSLLDIDDIVVKAILRENGPVFLSVSTLNPQSLGLALPGKTLVALKQNGKLTIEKPDEAGNTLSMRGNFIVDDKKQISGSVSVTYTNASDPWFVMLRDQNKMKNYIGGGLSSGDLKELKIITIGPVEAYVKYSVQKDQPFRNDTNYYFFSLPTITNGIDSWGIHWLPQKRTSSLEIPLLDDESYELSFIFPDGMKPFSAGKNVEIRNEAGNFLFEIKREGDKIIVKKSIHFNKRVITPEVYVKFKKLMDNWNSNPTREVVFVRE